MTKPRKTASHDGAGQGRLRPGTDRLKLDTLTRREAEVLGWLMEGKRDAEIARILGISEHTVHKHAQHIYQKLNVETRTAAARLGLANGFTPKPPRR